MLVYRFLGDQQLGFGLQQIKWGVTPLVAEEQECAGKPAECGATLITLGASRAKGGEPKEKVPDRYLAQVTQPSQHPNSPTRGM